MMEKSLTQIPVKGEFTKTMVNEFIHINRANQALKDRLATRKKNRRRSSSTSQGFGNILQVQPDCKLYL